MDPSPKTVELRANWARFPPLSCVWATLSGEKRVLLLRTAAGNRAYVITAVKRLGMRVHSGQISAHA